MAVWTEVMSRSRGGRLNGGGDALVAAAAADVAAHRAADFVLRGVLVGREEGCGLHDLAGLAIAALRDIQGPPSLLHRVIAVCVETLDRGHRSPGDVSHRGDAGAGGVAIDMHGAGAAQRHAAAEFCAGKPELVPQIPEQRHRRIAVARLVLAVDAELDHSCPPRLDLAEYFNRSAATANGTKRRYGQREKLTLSLIPRAQQAATIGAITRSQSPPACQLSALQIGFGLGPPQLFDDRLDLRRVAKQADAAADPTARLEAERGVRLLVMRVGHQPGD